MHDIECPYCNAGQAVDHDDGHGYEEGPKHEQECQSCGKTFTFTTSISYHYDPAKADCLNDGEHQWAMSNSYPRRATRWQCKDCDATKALTAPEMNALLKTES